MNLVNIFYKSSSIYTDVFTVVLNRKETHSLIQNYIIIYYLNSYNN